MHTIRLTDVLFLGILFVLLGASLASAKDASYIVVTPAWGDGGAFQCQIRPEKMPSVIENDLIRFRVKVRGGSGPYTWRLPLFKTKNGANDVSLARIGTVSLDDNKSFLLEVNVADLERLDRKELKVLLRSQERYETSCSTPGEGLRQLASSQPPKALSVIQGSIAR